MLFLDSVETLAIPRAPVDPLASAEAVEWFRNRVPVRRGLWKTLDTSTRRRAFTVAGATRLDILAQAWRAIDSAIASGTDFAAFQRAVAAELSDTWANSTGRLATVFRNNVQSAYSAGRFAQATDPDVLEARPFWRYEAILDSRTTRICQPLDGVTLPASDPFWRDHYPPLHHNCRSGVATLTDEQAAAEQTRTVPANAAPPQPGWGATPDLGEWSPDLNSYPPELAAAYSAWRATQGE